MLLAGSWDTWGCFVIEWFDVSRQGGGVMSSIQERSSGGATFGIACPTACRLGVGSEVSGGSVLAIVCVGGEGGTVYSSIWLLIEEAGMESFVLLCRGLPCAWWRFVLEIA